jgi:hypothetical protein
MPLTRFALPCAILLSAASSALAQTPDYGLTWRTIGDPGNAPLNRDDYFYFQGWDGAPTGSVSYQYRLTQTEVTNTQWIEFVDAYSRLHPEPSVVNDISFMGRDVYRGSNDPSNFGWYAESGAENAAAQMSWLYAARYCNWLQNGKVNEAWAFESGAYDMSTFVERPDHTWVGQTTRSPNAQFWIPSHDEWIKGMYWDPNKQGPGQGGYWLYPHSSDTPAVSGFPGTPGAQTSASLPSGPYFVPVGSYSLAASPWGLLDGSGGAREYTDGWTDLVLMKGSQTRVNLHISLDRLDFGGATPPTSFDGGLRIASSIPTPTTTAILTSLIPILTSRRRGRTTRSL